MPQPEFTRRTILASSALAGGAALASGPAASAAAGPAAASPSPAAASPLASYKPGSEPGQQIGPAGEVHQVATGSDPVLTTNQGVPIGDDQNSLKLGSRGPVLLEDFLLIEKINHFDHERIPERVVHAAVSRRTATSS